MIPSRQWTGAYKALGEEVGAKTPIKSGLYAQRRLNIEDIPRRPEFARFIEIYEKELLPYLTEQEAITFQRKEKARKNGMAALGLAAMAFLIPWRAIFGDEGFGESLAGLLRLGLLFAAGSIYLPVMAAGANTHKQIKKKLIQLLTREFNLTYKPWLTESIGFSRLKSWGLTPPFDTVEFQDSFSGVWRGVPFRFSEIELQKYVKRGKNSVKKAAFRGHLIETEFPRELFGRTVIMPEALDRELRGKHRAARNLKPVGLVSTAFENRYAVYSNDQVEARYILDPAYMEQMLALGDEADSSELRALFAGQAVVVAASGKNLFEVECGKTDFADPQTLARFLHELNSIFDLIDIVLKHQQSEQAA